MNNLDIESIIRKFDLNGIFQGCHPSDKIQPLRPRTVTIYNTSNSDIEMGHSTAVFCGEDPVKKPESKTCVYFDPFGTIPENFQLVQEILRFTPNLKYCNVQLQSIFSELCALHVLYAVILYCNQHSVEEIFTRFYHPNTADEFFNDRIVYHALLPELKLLKGGENLSDTFSPVLKFE